MSVSLADKIRFVDAIVAAQDLSPSAKLIGYVLSFRFHNHRTGRCFPSYDSIALAAGLKRRATAIEAVKELAVAGWIVIERGGGRAKTNQIELCFGRAETVRETAPFHEENGTENVPFEAVNGTQNRRKGTENVPDSLKNNPPASPVGGEGHPPGPGGPEFSAFWAACPHKVAEVDARAEFERVVISGEASVADLIAGMHRHAEATAGRKYPVEPKTWLRKKRWRDQPASPRSAGAHSAAGRRSNTDIAMEIIERMGQ